MAMIELTSEFREFLKLLTVHRVDYLLVGGYAVAHYGSPRFTAGIDIWIGATPENARRAADAMRAFGMPATGETERLIAEGTKTFRMGFPPNRIEILTRVSGVTFAECHARRGKARIGGVDIDIIALDDLKANKAAAGRPKDLADLSNLP